MTDRSIVLRIRAEIADAKRKLGDLGDTAKAQASQIEKTSASWNKMGDAAVVAGTAGAVALGLTAKAAIDWESAWAGVTKTVDGSTQEMAALEEGLRGLATTLPATHGEIAAVAEAAGQLGVAQKDILGFTRIMIDLGESTNLSADEAATSIAQISNVMGTLQREGAEGISRFGATLVELGNNGASTERDIVNMASRIAGAGKVVGLTEPELLAVANALASVGIEAEAGGTAVSNVLIDMSKAVQTGSEDLGRFAKVAGLSADAFAAKFKDSPAEAMNLFTQGLGRIKAEGGDVFTTLSDLGQSDIRVTSALLKMAGAGDLLTQSLADGNRAWSENNALQAEAAKRYETSAARIQIARNAVNEAAIDFGSALAPTVTEAAEAVGGAAQKFSDLDESTQGAIVKVATVTTGILLFGGVTIKATTSILSMVTAMKAAEVGGTKLGGALKGLAGVGVVIGIATVAEELTKLQAAAAVPDVEVDRMAASLEGLAHSGKLVGGVADLFRDDNGIFADEKYVSSADALKRFGDAANFAFRDGAFADLDRLSPLGQKSIASFEERLKSLDAGLAQMVSSGNAEGAAAAFDALMSSFETNSNPEVADKARAAFTQYLAVAKDAPSSQAPMTSGAAEMAAALGENATAAQEAAYSTEEYIEALDALRNPVLDAREAELQVREAITAVKDAREEHGKALNKSRTGFNLNTEAGIANQRALDDVARSLGDQIGALEATGASQEELDGKLRSSRDRLYDVAIEMGLTKDAARAYVEEVLRIPPARNTTVTADTAPATASVKKFEQYINNLRGNATIDVRYVDSARSKGGGRNTQGGQTKFDTGGYTGDGGKYEPKGIVHGGEFVHTAEKTTRHRGLFEHIHAGGDPRSYLGVRGYAGGGFVGTTAFPAPAAAGGVPVSRATHFNFDIREVKPANFGDFLAEAEERASRESQLRSF